MCVCVCTYVCTCGAILSCSSGTTCFEDRIEQCCAALKDDLRRLNDDVYRRVWGQLDGAVSNLSNHIRYQFLEHHGPQRQLITIDQSLFPRSVHFM